MNNLPVSVQPYLIKYLVWLQTLGNLKLVFPGKSLTFGWLLLPQKIIIISEEIVF
jgi:hypothetical protein